MSVFGALEELRNRPIGEQASARTARIGFRSRIPLAQGHALFGEAVVEAQGAGLAGEIHFSSQQKRSRARARGQPVIIAIAAQLVDDLGY